MTKIYKQNKKLTQINKTKLNKITRNYQIYKKIIIMILLKIQIKIEKVMIIKKFKILIIMKKLKIKQKF